VAAVVTRLPLRSTDVAADVPSSAPHRASCEAGTWLVVVYLLLVNAFFALLTDWSWWMDSSWSTNLAAIALLPYIGTPGTVISLLRTARWCSPRQVQSPWIRLDPFCPLPTVSNWGPTSWRRPADSPVACGTPGRLEVVLFVQVQSSLQSLEPGALS